jgi:hypothetical protein
MSFEKRGKLLRSMLLSGGVRSGNKGPLVNILGSIPVVGVFVEKEENWLILLEAELGVDSVS